MRITILLPILLAACSDKQEAINYLDQQAPGREAKLFAPGVVSTENMEHSAPAFSPDGTVALWAVVTETYRSYLLEATLENGKWSAPHRPSFADTTADDYYPCFSPDGQTLYFSSRRKLPEGYPARGDMRIWQVTREHGSWGRPQPFDTAVSRGQEYAHSISSNGTLYFSSSLSGATNWNIRKSGKTPGGYRNPELLPYGINSVDYEDGPCIAPDESFIIFESQRADGIGNSIDLYIAFKTPGGQWSLPVNMGPAINTPATERFARLSPDGKYLFFGSTKDQSQSRRGWDIYWIDAVFDKAMAIHSGSYPYFHRAGALAKAGRKDDAFAALTRAVELGGIASRDEFEAAPNLQSLKPDERWNVLMEKLK